HLENVFPTPKKNRRILLLKCKQARIGRTFGIPIKNIQWIEPSFEEAHSQPLITLHPLSGGEVDLLDVTEHATSVAGLHLDREYAFSSFPRLYQLGKAPLGGQPVWRQQRNHGLTLAQILIERLFPSSTALNASLRIEVEEKRCVT